MTIYPNLNNMTDIELVLLHNEVADSKDETDIDFRDSIVAKLKERCITVELKSDSPS